MIRILAATSVRCAAGRMAVEDLSKLLRDRSPRLSYVAPAGGLYLVRVIY